MAVQDNVWNAQLGRWENPVDQTWMTPNGNWTNAQGWFYNPNASNPQWINPNQPIGGNQQQPKSSQGGQGSYNPQSGYGWELLNQDYSFQNAQQTLKGNQAKELAALDSQYKMQINQQLGQIDLMKAQKQIDADTANLMKKLAQQESEFARTMAQHQLEFQHQQQMDQLSQEIARAAEQRQERQLQANLSANPTDWVAYQFYKRGLTDPTMNGGAQSGPPGTPGTTSNPTMINGQPYTPSAPASSDQAIQTMATALFAPAGSSPTNQWGTNLGGSGVFGTNVPTPATFSRGQAANASDADLSMISGLLRAGVDYGSTGQRTALDPTEWFNKAQKWWIPTEKESNQVASTRYS